MFEYVVSAFAHDVEENLQKMTKFGKMCTENESLTW